MRSKSFPRRSPSSVDVTILTAAANSIPILIGGVGRSVITSGDSRAVVRDLLPGPCFRDISTLLLTYSVRFHQELLQLFFDGLKMARSERSRGLSSNISDDKQYTYSVYIIRIRDPHVSSRHGHAPVSWSVPPLVPPSCLNDSPAGYKRRNPQQYPRRESPVDTSLQAKPSSSQGPTACFSSNTPSHPRRRILVDQKFRLLLPVASPRDLKSTTDASKVAARGFCVELLAGVRQHFRTAHQEDGGNDRTGEDQSDQVVERVIEGPSCPRHGCRS